MLVKLKKLTFYHFQPNPELLFYYAVTDTVTFRGVATPELALALIDHLDAGTSFKCKLEEREDGSFKLTELLDEAETNHTKRKVFYRNNYKILEFEPKQISIYKQYGRLCAAVKTTVDEVFFGSVDKDWVMWYLTILRHGECSQMMINGKKFLMNTEKIDAPHYFERNESCYIDNEEKFFCANKGLNHPSAYLNK